MVYVEQMVAFGVMIKYEKDYMINNPIISFANDCGRFYRHFILQIFWVTTFCQLTPVPF